jgi:hypothetical protein
LRNFGTSRYFIVFGSDLKTLYRKFKDTKFKIGETDKGKPINVKLKYFMIYLLQQRDDSPLYLFEPDLEERVELKSVILNYNVPKYFSEDDYFKEVIWFFNLKVSWERELDLLIDGF